MSEKFTGAEILIKALIDQVLIRYSVIREGK